MIDIVLLGAYSFAIGLCVGSFLNVVVLRAFSEESIVLPPSKCPKCNNPLKWYHNIPLLSYIFLGGKCAYCKEKISIQYPIVEFLTGVLFLILFLVFGISFNTLFAWIFAAFLMVMSVTDIKERVVFDRHVYSFIVVMYIISLVKYSIGEWWMGLSGIILAFVVFELLARIGYLFTDSRMFGEGDTYIAMGIGVFLGPIGVIAVTALSIIIDVIIMFPIMLFKAVKSKNKNMTIGLILAMFVIIIGILFNTFGSNLNKYLMYAVLILGIIVPAIVSIILILKDIKKKKTEELFMPAFGPALAIAGIIVLFVMEYMNI